MDVAASKFEPFPRLPAELRLKIWSYFLPGPRLVEVVWKVMPVHTPVSNPSNPKRIKARYIGNERPPTLLHICQECREEARRNLTLRLATDDQHSPIFIDPVRDTVYLRCEQYGPYSSSNRDCLKQLFGIRHLIMDHGLLLSRPKPMVSMFENLETLTIVGHGRVCVTNYSFAWNLCQDISFLESNRKEEVSGEERRYLEELTAMGNKSLDTLQVESPYWKRPQLRYVFLKLDGTRCCPIR
jgi:hypothetical protein